MNLPALPADISSTVRRALNEDIGNGDLTAELIPPDQQGKATVTCREQAILCGTAWFNEVFLQVDDSIRIEWSFQDGEELSSGDQVCSILGRTRKLITAERTALNFLQLLSGTATVTRRFVSSLKGMNTTLLDTRKTIPGLRTAQKYAVACGGGMNHRMGLYDAILIKENHIKAAGGIREAIEQSRSSNRKIEIEVETLGELGLAIEAGADTVMLDNFRIRDMTEAVKLNRGRVKLEASGNINLDTVADIAATGVDYISIGELTKNVQAVDFSMRIM